MILSHDDRCPCGTGEIFGACCGRFHHAFAEGSGIAAPTPEALMRSRFTAFAAGNEPYLLATWHPSTRPASLELDPTLRWYRLDILATSGGVFDSTGTVEFAAHYRSQPGTPEDERVRGVQREKSRFERVNGEWMYVDGEVL